MSKRPQRGFTIIELLVATAVFAVVLLVVTTGIIQVTRVYYKGLTEANTQDTARNIIDVVSQGIQFTGGLVTTTPTSPTAPSPGTSESFCVGDMQFSYTLGYQLMDTPDPTKFQSYHVIVANDGASCSSGTPDQNVRQPNVIGREMMNPRMRLANLQVASLGNNMYRVQVRVVYGDDDLLNNPTSRTASCASVRAGSQFCAVSDLSTVVIKRVQ